MLYIRCGWQKNYRPPDVFLERQRARHHENVLMRHINIGIAASGFNFLESSPKPRCRFRRSPTTVLKLAPFDEHDFKPR